MTAHSSFKTSSDHRKLKNLATEFRRAIESSPSVATILPTLQLFPLGACGEASLLLAKYLEANGCGHFTYCHGSKDGRHHAWLQQADVIVDITADQFNDNREPVIVTVDHSWHSRFSQDRKLTANFDEYDDRFRCLAQAAYDSVLEVLKHAPQSDNEGTPPNA